MIRFIDGFSRDASCARDTTGHSGGYIRLMIDTLKGAALVAFMVSGATCAHAGEHWVCSIPHKLEPTRTVILDYQVRGDKLLMDLGVEYQIIRNDDRVLVAVHTPINPNLSPPDSIAQVIGIEKQRGNGWRYLFWRG
jgi:hypothetical protein